MTFVCDKTSSDLGMSAGAFRFRQMTDTIYQLFKSLQLNFQPITVID